MPPDVLLFTSRTYLSNASMSRSPSLVYFEHTPFCIGPVPVPLYLLTIRISLYSLFLYLCFSLLLSIVSLIVCTIEYTLLLQV